MAFHHGPHLGGGNLSFYYDAGLVNSYPHSGSSWYNLIDNTSVTGSVTESWWRNRNEFYVSESKVTLPYEPFNFKSTQAKTFSFWFTPHKSGSHLFNIDNVFRIWICENLQATILLHPTMDMSIGSNLVVDDNIWFLKGSGNNHWELAKYDKNFNFLGARWFLISSNWIYPSRNTNIRAVSGSESHFITNVYYGACIISSSNFPFNYAASSNYRNYLKTGGTGIPQTYCYYVRDADADQSYIYWSDYNNSRITKYQKDATVTYVTHSTVAGPGGICIDSDYVYYIERGGSANASVRKASKTDMQFVATQSFAYAQYLDHDSSYLYVSAFGRTGLNPVIRKIDKSTMAIVASTASSGAGDTQLGYVYGVSVSGSLLYIFDFGNNRFVTYNTSDLSFAQKFTGSVSVYVDPNASSLVNSNRYWDRIWYGNHPSFVTTSGSETNVHYSFMRDTRVRKHILNGFGDGTFTGSVYSLGDVADIYDCDTDGTYAYIVDNDKSRAHKYDLATWTRLYTHGTASTTGTGSNLLYSPRGIAVDDNYVYVSEYGNDRIKTLNKSDLSYVTMSYSNSSGSFDNMWGLTISGSYLYVCQAQAANSLRILNKDTFDQVGTINWSGGHTYCDVDESYIYAIDQNLYVRKYDKNTFTLVLSKYMASPNTTTDPYPEYPNASRYVNAGITVRGDYLYVAEGYGYRILNKNDLTFVNEWFHFTDTAVTTKRVAFNQLNNLVFTFESFVSGSILRMYLNGEDAGSRVIYGESTYRSAINATMGLYNARSTNFSNEVDIHSVMVYDSTLQASTIKQSYDNLRVRYK